MQISLQKNATTTRKVCAPLPASMESNVSLPRRFRASVEAIARWKHGNSMEVLPHSAHWLRMTLNGGQQGAVLAQRQNLDLSTEDLLAATRELIHTDTSGAALHWMLNRHWVSARSEPESANSAHPPFKTSEPGYVYVTVTYLPQMSDEASSCYLFVVVDGFTGMVQIDVKTDKTDRTARAAKSLLVSGTDERDASV